MQPEPIFASFFRELVRDRPISELRLRAIIRECKAQIPKVSFEQAAHFYHAMGVAHWRLGNFESVLEAEAVAARLLPRDSAILGTLGAALTALGRHAEAAETLVKALEVEEKEGHALFVTLSNLSEVLWRMGDRDGAIDAFREAEAAAKNDDASHQLMLANQAAEIGAFRDALGFFANFLSLHRGAPVKPSEIAGLMELSDEERSIVAGMRGLRRMLTRIDDTGSRGLDLMLAPAPGQAHRSGDGAVAVLRETEGLRARAMSAILGRGNESEGP
jgi:tetratricopeptide (TPR) repeat protein